MLDFDSGRTQAGQQDVDMPELMSYPQLRARRIHHAVHRPQEENYSEMEAFPGAFEPSGRNYIIW